MVPDAEVVVGLDGPPVLRVDDPIFARGDGVFETMLLRDERPVLLDAHLDRLADSAAVIGLPPPDRDRWRAAVGRAVAQWRRDGDAVVRLVYGRGATSFVTVSAVPDRVLRARAHGVSVVTVERGVPSVRAPWSLAHAKSSSYAVSMAALQYAGRRGCDDSLFISLDGFVLEGPRSTVVVCSDGELLTPPASLPILHGITGRALFEQAAGRGVRCAEAMLTTADLLAAQSVWFVSSVTLAARVHTLDETALRKDSTTVDVPALLDRAIVSGA